MESFTYKATPQNKRAIYLFIAFAIGAVAFTILYLNMIQYRGLVGFVAMIFIVAAVFMYTRYMAAEYHYDVLVEGESRLFVVRHRLGNRETTMCRIDLHSILSVERQTKEERKAHTTPAEYKKYSYSPTVAPEVTYLITSSSRTEKAEITIEANDEFAATLMRYVSEIKAEYPTDEEYE